MQSKIKMFVGTALLVDEPVTIVERRFTRAGQRRRCQLHIKIEKNNAPKSTEPWQSFGISMCREHSMQFSRVAYNETLFYISYSLCLAFRLCSSIGVFYTNLEVIKLVSFEIKRRYVCCIFTNFIFTFETKI